MIIYDRKLVVPIVGEADAGKTETCAYLADKYGLNVILVSDIIRGFARMQPGQIDRSKAAPEF